MPNPHTSRALAAWREANPQGLIGRLVELHQRDPERARWLAYYIEQYHADRTPPGERWPYQELMVDVARWPVVHGPSRLRIAYPDMPPDRTLCPVCDWGRVAPRGIGESLADTLDKFPELGVEEALEEIPCPSCGGTGRWGDDIPCGRCWGWGSDAR